VTNLFSAQTDEIKTRFFQAFFEECQQRSFHKSMTEMNLLLFKRFKVVKVEKKDTNKEGNVVKPNCLSSSYIPKLSNSSFNNKIVLIHSDYCSGSKLIKGGLSVYAISQQLCHCRIMIFSTRSKAVMVYSFYEDYHSQEIPCFYAYYRAKIHFSKKPATSL
jgi:hypothetical protein